MVKLKNNGLVDEFIVASIASATNSDAKLLFFSKIRKDW